jgi:hypothetical protein
MFILFIANVAVEFHNPARYTGHHANPAVKTDCSALRSNMDGRDSKAVLPARMPDAESLVPFAKAYGAALDAHSLGELQQMYHNTTGVWQWSTAQLPIFGSYVNMKLHILDAFENRMNVTALWSEERSLLDIGGANGYLGAYLSARHGLEVVVYDIPFSTECKTFLNSIFKVNFFFGDIPERACSYDAVSFMNVLHHAANHTETLLKQASKIARRWILLTEDIDVGSNHAALRKHDPNGIFRSDAEWKDVFARYAPRFTLRSSGYIAGRKHGHGYKTGHPSPYHGVSGDDSSHTWYVLERNANEEEGCQHAHSHASSTRTVVEA